MTEPTRPLRPEQIRAMTEGCLCRLWAEGKYVVQLDPVNFFAAVQNYEYWGTNPPSSLGGLEIPENTLLDVVCAHAEDFSLPESMRLDCVWAARKLLAAEWSVMAVMAVRVMPGV